MSDKINENDVALSRLLSLAGIQPTVLVVTPKAEDVAEEDNVPPNFIFKDKYLKQLSKIDTKNIHARKEIMTIFGDSELTDRFISRFKW